MGVFWDFVSRVVSLPTLLGLLCHGGPGRAPVHKNKVRFQPH